MGTMSQLLVSVRSVVEAEAALAGGAGLIDIKEPSRGPLGRAGLGTIATIVQYVGGRTPVSAALGEFLEEPVLPALANLDYFKWGLAGAAESADWETDLARTLQTLPATGARPVAVAYADWQRAHAPPIDQTFSWGTVNGAGAFLLDTWGKDGTTLLDWLSIEQLARLATKCRQSGLPLALAGSLGEKEIAKLMPLGPDWFAVRGAACIRGRRDGSISSSRVKALAQMLETEVPAG
jgi:uncharacterized protein (UPF0264 family)